MYKHYRNSHAFDDMNGQVAYWLGFLYTDGCVYDNNTVRLKLKDLDSIEQFKSFLKYAGSITTVTNHLNGKEYISYQVSVTDYQLAKKIKELGCVPRKTNVLVFPSLKQLPIKYYDSFLRGVFDGDGCVSHGDRCVRVSFIGTENFLIGVKNALVVTGVTSADHIFIGKAHTNNTQIKTLSFQAKDAILNFYNLIYNNNDTYYLKRKKERYEELINRQYPDGGKQ